MDGNGWMQKATELQTARTGKCNIQLYSALYY